MELWIRSQDKYTLIKAENIKIIETKGLKEKLENSILSCLSDMEQVKSYLKDGYSILVDENNVGVYESKERALEVLDEIQNRLHQTFICDLKCQVYKRDYENIKSDLEHEYPSKEFIIQPQHYELKPINSDVVIYKMPEE